MGSRSDSWDHRLDEESCWCSRWSLRAVVPFLLVATILQPVWVASEATSPAVIIPKTPCLGVLVVYVIDQIVDIPSVWSGARRPHGFRSRIQLLNSGVKDLAGWDVVIDFQRKELITSLINTQVYPDLPTPGGGNLTFSSVPGQSDEVLTAINSAGDISQFVVTAKVNGTEWGAATAERALPRGIRLLNRGYYCPKEGVFNPTSSSIAVCCQETQRAPPPPPKKTVLQIKGDIEVLFDVTWSGETDHWVLVSILNHQQLRRVEPPGWELSWKWARKEIIWEMHGAQATQSGECLESAAAQLYGAGIQGAHSCSPKPVIKDLGYEAYDADSYTDTNMFNTVLSCCKNGTLGVPTFPFGDPAFVNFKGNSSVAQFRMRVGRMKRSELNFLRDVAPPYALSLGLPNFNCSAPEKLDPPSMFPANLDRNRSAVATWRYSCFRQPSKTPPSCCVSFSAFYNHTPAAAPHSASIFGNWLSFFNGQGSLYVSPCPTCSCGCNATAAPPPPPKKAQTPGTSNKLSSSVVPLWNTSNQCAAKGTLFDDIGSEGDIVPTQTWRDQPMLSAQCLDHCPVHVHWHVSDFFSKGWLAKMTIVNRGSVPVVNWYSSVRLSPKNGNATAVYSFKSYNATDSLWLLWGYRGNSDWILNTTASRFGNVKSVFQFSNNGSMNLTNATAHFLFPLEITVNGNSCVIPTVLPLYTPPAQSRLPISLVYIGLISAIVFSLLLSYGILA